MGNVGGHAASIFAEHGHRVVAMSDSKSGVYDENGLDVSDIEDYKKSHGSLTGYPGAKSVSNAELLELPVDALIPAALENQITERNAPRVKAKLVLELANGPTTPEADDILHERGVVVVPDVLANSGGVIVSTFEWQQNRAGEHWSEKDVLDKLRKTLSTQAALVHDMSEELSRDLRTAAFVLALGRIENAMGAGGARPSQPSLPGTHM
jgi:glutamate dehydrogenase (NAD(P)+)